MIAQPLGLKRDVYRPLKLKPSDGAPKIFGRRTGCHPGMHGLDRNLTAGITATLSVIIASGETDWKPRTCLKQFGGFCAICLKWMW